MKYRITHSTKYAYADTVPFCQNVVYLTPRAHAHQSCSRHRLTIHPHPATSHRRPDYFGNSATLFSIDKGHRTLQITATSSVELQAPALPVPSTTATWESVRDQLPSHVTAAGLANYQFAFRSPHVPFHASLKEYALESFGSGRPILQALEDLNGRIHSDFEYDPKATTVSTPILDVFETRRGVCQDLAHLMLGCLRPLGLAARYVSGYLRTQSAKEKERLTGSDASHAWLSVYCGADGWIDVDPTNNVFPSTEHLTVAWGRDYSDVCPVAGMFIGDGRHRLSVAVDVVAI